MTMKNMFLGIYPMSANDGAIPDIFSEYPYK